MTAKATYSRKSKEWQVVSDDCILNRFPSGKENAELAMIAAIRFNDPEVYALAFYLANDLFRDHPDVNGRLWRAAEIVINGDVKEPYHIDGRSTVSRVRSQNPKPHEHGKHHRIDRPEPNGRYFCSCYDHQDNDKCPAIHGQKLCKHILAVKLMKLAERPLIAWPTPQLDERDQWLADFRKRQEESGQRLTNEEMERQLEEKRENMRRWRFNREMQERQQESELANYTADDFNTQFFA